MESMLVALNLVVRALGERRIKCSVAGTLLSAIKLAALSPKYKTQAYPYTRPINPATTSPTQPARQSQHQHQSTT